MDQNATKRDESAGRLMYMASERPDAQFAIQSLAKKMAAPTKEAWRRAWHLCSYTSTARSTLDLEYASEEERRGDRCLLIHERMWRWIQKSFICWKWSHAGSRDDRKSTSSFQICIDGDLMESRVRSARRRCVLTAVQRGQWCRGKASVVYDIFMHRC